MAFSFGSTTANKPVFGTATTASGSLFGNTGGLVTATTSGFGGFGTTNTFGQGTSNLGGNTFGSTSNTLGGTNTFGPAGTTFGASTGLGGGNTFGGGGLGSTNTAFGGTFGGGLSSTSTFSSGLGTGLNTSSGLSTGFQTGTGFSSGLGGNLGGGFGSGLGTGLGTGLNLGGQQQNQQLTEEQAKSLQVANLATAVSLPVIFGNECDSVIAKWNQLQAYWGFGKAYYIQGGCVSLDASNPFCRFKAVGYSVMPKTRNKDGIVGIIFNKNIDDIQKHQAQIVDFIHKVCGSKQNISICVESVKALPEDKTEMLIFVQEKSPNGTMKRLTATDVFNVLNTQNIRSQLTSNVAVETIIPKTGLTADQLKQYLDTPPNGIDPLIWRQAKLDNPDPENLIPVPMIGFQELHKRLKHQEQQTKLHQRRLDVISQDISKLQSKQTDMLAKMEQYKRKHLELSHKVLQVMVRQERYRKLGYAIQAEEEALRVQLEVIQAELNAPTQFKGRLNELMSQLRMQSKLGMGRPDASCHMETPIQLEIKQFLKQQQEGLQHLMGIIREDLDDLRIIDQGYTDTAVSHLR